MGQTEMSPSRIGQVFKTLAYGLYLLLFLFVGIIFGWARRSPSITRVISDPRLILFSDARKAFDNHDSETILVLGCDEDRVYSGGYKQPGIITRAAARTDMMMVARLDFTNHTITGLSIPRDTECRLPGYGDEKIHKINAYYSMAKPGEKEDLTKKAVEYMLPGVTIDKVVAVDFDRFQELVDLVGGVDMTVTEKMDYDDFAGELHIHFKPGTQHLKGKDAIALIRFRHNKDGDFGRQKREHDLLLSLKSAVMNHWTQLPAIAEQGKRTLGNGLSDDQIIALALFARKVPTDQIKMVSLPIKDSSGTFLIQDKPATKTLLATLGFTQPDPEDQQKPSKPQHTE